jgi:Family of unknown function (DUF6445)
MTQTIRVDHIGREAVPIIVIDNFVARPELLAGDASMLGFAPMGPHYPGVRAVVPPALVKRFVDPLEGVIADVFGVRDCVVVDALYSLVTTMPDALTPIQRLPHFDGVEPERLALLHFLGRGENGGTAFYRHRSTGFERVTAARHPAYTQRLESEISTQGMPDPAYISGDTDLFEEIAVYEGMYNRALLYPSNVLHCARIPDGVPHTTNPDAGRLTVNTFLMGVSTREV